MNRVLLVRTFRDMGAGGAVPPVGLLYIASALRKAFPGGCDVRLLDTCFEKDPAASVSRAVSEFSPGVAGFSSLSCEAPLAHELAEAAKKADAGVFTVFGGPYPTATPAAALADANVDACVLGEGENTAAELIAALSTGFSPAGVPGTACRGEGRMVMGPARPFIENLDCLEMPAWDCVDLGRYSKLPNWNGYLKETTYAPLLTSRGCPFHCVYCHNLFGKKARVRSPRNIISEIIFLREKRGAREFHIIDDVFNADKARALEFCRLVKEQALDLAFSFPNGLRADLVDEELMAALKGIGAYKIHYGIESASERIRKAIKKDLPLEKVSEAVALADSYGITTAGYFMLGFPGETAHELRETAEYAAASRLDAAYFFKATAYPGTELFNSLPPEKRPSGQAAFFSAGESAVDAEELDAALLDAQRRFYLSPRRLWRLARKSHNLRGFLRTFPKFLANLVLIFILDALKKRPPKNPAAT